MARAACTACGLGRGSDPETADTVAVTSAMVWGEGELSWVEIDNHDDLNRAREIACQY